MQRRSNAPLRGGLLLVALGAGCGPKAAPVPPAVTPPAAAASSPTAPVIARGAIYDAVGNVLVVGGKERQPSGPASLRAWVPALERSFDPVLKQGHDVRSTLDARVHRELENVFATVTRGAAVIIDVSSGAVVALFSKGERSGDRPLVERHLATAEAREPGSAFKPFAALAGLAHGAIREHTTHECKGFIELEQRRFRCHGSHGELDLTHALSVSDNVYFYRVALEIRHDELVAAQKALAFGERVGILGGDAPGVVPNREALVRRDGQYLRARTLNQAIGHGAVRVTPLQMARAYSVLATGRWTVLHVRERSAATAPTRHQLEPYAEGFAAVRKGLVAAVRHERGTAHFDEVRADVAGKTGTADGSGPRANTRSAWFAGWAPAEHPKVAFAFVTEEKTGRATARLAFSWLGQTALGSFQPGEPAQ